MFKKGESHFTHRVSGVPGTVRGMEMAHKFFGKLPWKDLIMPAVDLAEKGFKMNGSLASSLNGVVGKSGDLARRAGSRLR